MIRASYKRKWRGNWYEKDEMIPANEKQEYRMVKAGQAYYDVLPDKPTMDCLKSEIQDYLEAEQIDYSESMTKAELLELVDGS